MIIDYCNSRKKQININTVVLITKYSLSIAYHKSCRRAEHIFNKRKKILDAT